MIHRCRSPCLSNRDTADRCGHGKHSPAHGRGWVAQIKHGDTGTLGEYGAVTRYGNIGDHTAKVRIRDESQSGGAR
jgi:hypothetical protein